MKFYEYAACSTCKKARKYLEQQAIAFEAIPIVEHPPTPAELKRMLGYLQSRGGGLKNLFNTSGEVYRALKVSDQLAAGMTEAQAIDLLSRNGKLVKRPFVLTKTNGTVGFQETLWGQIFS